MDQLAALRALRRVVELGSFTAAGDALGISHTVVSRQVRQLENHLGAQLLNRTTRRFALTDAGRDYYEACRQILDALDDADRAVGRHQAQPTGTLRINAPMAFGTLELAQWLPRFAARYPQLHVDLVCNDRIVDLIEEGFDVALRLTRDLPDSTLVARRLADSAVVLVASPDYLRRHGTPALPDDLVRHNCLCYTLDERPFEWTFVQPDGTTRAVQVRGTLQANTGVALRSAAVAGLGIAASASFIVDEYLRRGELVPLLPGYPLRPRALYAMYPQNRHLAPKVRAFVDFAAEIYGGRG
ncbi:DNA-binding transcriptional LysR family regulator [Pseudoduganella flava]|uniref:DNA-binding transcriptional LysR family regulator n=1 Tax=Pseudoduganella flava TaxID=871742 RepID=A0A562Q316_9BURK|nr:LysR family transcriptional regulator [Pseudoduganella flava]QGZ41144.1 LysR family transcriptional regulator [Pseudoduganella flava]TWI51074.1 DNA-binding transcriptional LysR family regulator [Pseudoduganella flava]